MKFFEYEKLLTQWLCKIVDGNVSVTDKLMREKSKQIIESLNPNKTENEKSKLIQVMVG